MNKHTVARGHGSDRRRIRARSGSGDMLKWWQKPVEIRGWMPIVLAVNTVFCVALLLALGQGVAQTLVSPLTLLSLTGTFGLFAIWQRNRQRNTGGTAS